MNTYINHRWVSLGPAHLHLVEIAGECPVTGGCLFIAIGIGISPAKKMHASRDPSKSKSKKVSTGGRGNTVQVCNRWVRTNK